MARPIKQTVDYFPHDSDASEGKTLTILFNNFGHEGISCWWQLLEIVSRTNNHVISTRNHEDLEYLAAKLHFKQERLIKILNKLADLEAIDRRLWQQNIIWIQGFVDRLREVYIARRQQLPVKPELSLPENMPVTERMLLETELSVPEKPLSVSETKLPVPENTVLKMPLLVPKKSVPEMPLPVPEKPLSVPETELSVPENTQSKVNKSKVNNISKDILDTLLPTAGSCPYQKIADIYQQKCPTLPKVSKITAKRKEKIRLRWHESGESLDQFEKLFDRVGISDFLSGKNGKWPSCNFDWIIDSETRVARILEGTYDNKQPANQSFRGTVPKVYKDAEEYSWN